MCKKEMNIDEALTKIYDHFNESNECQSFFYAQENEELYSGYYTSMNVSGALSAFYPIQRQAAMLQFFAGAQHGQQTTHHTPTILA
jgi:hypothetical protein